MYDRAPRNLTFKVGCTPEALGPGSYETNNKLAFKGDGYAPFLSMSSREHANDQVIIAPGPGYYDISSLQDGPKGRGPLANKSKRFHDSINETPGPGAYHCHKYLEIGHKPKSAPGLGSEEKGMLVSNRIQFYRKPEAPSIPSQGQVYGYEECDDGTLKRQDPPQRDMTLGPAYYSPVVPLSNSTKTYKGANFSRLSSRRFSFPAKTGPGPGDYDPYVAPAVKVEHANVHGAENLRYEPRIPRYHEQIEIQEKKKGIPGPGSYEVKSLFLNPPPALNTEGIEVEHPPFLSQSQRFTPVKSTVPAPGTYNDPRTALGVLNRIKGLKRSPFSQTSVRFGKENPSKLMPGPGAYNIPGLGAEMLRKAYMEATRKGVFGTTSSRTQPFAKSNQPDMPGPAHYHVEEKRFHSHYPQLGSNFASVTRRLKTEENEVPPPGSYDIVTAFEKSQVKPPMAKPRSEAASRKHSSFMSAAPRFSTNRDFVSPGPGSYSFSTEALSKRGGVIPAREKRFLDNKQDFPGPGSYELSPLIQDTVLKGTFNHTLGNPIMAAEAQSQAQTSSKPAFHLGV